MTENFKVIRKLEESNSSSRNKYNINLVSNNSNNNFSRVLSEIESNVFPNYDNTIVLKQSEEKIELNTNCDNVIAPQLEENEKVSARKEDENIKINQTMIKNNLNKYQERNKDYIKHLIKFIIFKKEFLLEKNSFQNSLTRVYAIKSKIVKKLMNLFNIKNIIANLNNSKILDKVTYNNFDKSYYKILDFLYKNNINSNIEEIQFNKNERVLVSQNLSNLVNLNYLSDFELIDKSFADFLKKNIAKITIRPVDFGIIKNNKVFLAIKFGENTFYEVMHLNTDNNLIFEYLIKNTKNTIYEKILALNNFIFGNLCWKPIQSLISNKRKNEISLANNKVILNLYQKNISPQKSKEKRDYPDISNYSRSNIGDDSIITSMNVSRITYIGNFNDKYTKKINKYQK